MKYLFCGGGTAGHVSPALAIADEIQKREPDAEILFVGRLSGKENEAILKRGYSLKEINIQGFVRKLSFENIRRGLLAVKSLISAKKILKDFKPDIVFGTGGYVCWPVLKTAKKLGIPTALHESNATPGLVTRLLYKGCDKLFLGFEGAKNEFENKDNISVVGNPVNNEFYTLDKATARKRLGIGRNVFLISSFGGSGGSEKVNEAVINLMQMHSLKSRGIMHYHSAGHKYYEKIKNENPKLCQKGEKCVILPYVSDMPTLICASDIVITRCGAITLSEIIASNVVSIIIPSPNVTNNHQYKNGLLLSKSDSAIMIEESDHLSRDLYDAVRRLEVDRKRREKIKENLLLHRVKNTAEEIVNEIERIIKK